MQAILIAYWVGNTPTILQLRIRNKLPKQQQNLTIAHDTTKSNYLLMQSTLLYFGSHLLCVATRSDFFMDTNRGDLLYANDFLVLDVVGIYVDSSVIQSNSMELLIGLLAMKRVRRQGPHWVVHVFSSAM